MYVKMVIASLGFLLLQHVIRLLIMMDFGNKVFNHTPGPCHIVPGIEFGSEDMQTLSNGLTFITSGMAMPLEEDRYIGDTKMQGRIYLFDFENPAKGVVELGIEGFSLSRLCPHGISLWQNPENDQILVFIVNHSPTYDSVEKFAYVSDRKVLKHQKTYTNTAFKSANDVLATSENTFYFTNFASRHSILGIALELFLLLPFGSIVYYDGMKYHQAVEGLLTPNGLAISSDKKYVYLATSITRDMKIFQRENDGNLILLEELPLYTSLDNPTIDHSTGNILIGSHPVMHKVIVYLDKPLVPAPSQVLLLNVDGGNITKVTELYSDDGSTIYGSSVASLYGKQILIGTVYHKLLYCKVNVFE